MTCSCRSACDATNQALPHCIATRSHSHRRSSIARSIYALQNHSQRFCKIATAAAPQGQADGRTDGQRVPRDNKFFRVPLHPPPRKFYSIPSSIPTASKIITGLSVKFTSTQFSLSHALRAQTPRRCVRRWDIETISATDDSYSTHRIRN